jgi:predicted enzyme related to lactoylglutathione lyase
MTPAEAPAAITGSIAQIALTVHDVSAAVGFYRDAVGLRQLPIPAPNLAFFDCGGIRLMLAGPEGEFVPGGSAIYFATADIDATHAAMQSRGVSFRGAPHVIARLPDREVWLAEFRDPSGNVLALMEERPTTR